MAKPLISPLRRVIRKKPRYTSKRAHDSLPSGASLTLRQAFRLLCRACMYISRPSRGTTNVCLHQAGVRIVYTAGYTAVSEITSRK